MKHLSFGVAWGDLMNLFLLCEERRRLIPKLDRQVVFYCSDRGGRRAFLKCEQYTDFTWAELCLYHFLYLEGFQTSGQTRKCLLNQTCSVL